MASMPYDVVLLPEETIYEKAIGLSKRLATHGTHFTLDGHDYIPHLSLYMLQLTDEGVEEASRRLSEVAARTSAVACVAKQYHSSHEYLDVEYEKTEPLSGLQSEVIAALNPIRDGLREKDQERLLMVVGTERDNILTFGYRSVGATFFPHLTFTRFLEHHDIPADLPPKEDFSGAFPTLALMEMGDHGTCCKRIAEARLG